MNDADLQLSLSSNNEVLEVEAPTFSLLNDAYLESSGDNNNENGECRSEDDGLGGDDRSERIRNIPELGEWPPIRSSSQSDMVDTLVPVEDEIPDVGAEESPREMWKGRVFYDRDTFRKTLGKFAVYNNFELKHIKSNNC